MCSVELLQLLVRDEENDVPRAHPHPGRDETFVQRSEAFVAHRLHGTVDAAGVIQTGVVVVVVVAAGVMLGCSWCTRRWFMRRVRITSIGVEAIALPKLAIKLEMK